MHCTLTEVMKNGLILLKSIILRFWNIDIVTCVSNVYQRIWTSATFHLSIFDVSMTPIYTHTYYGMQQFLVQVHHANIQCHHVTYIYLIVSSPAPFHVSILFTVCYHIYYFSCTLEHFALRIQFYFIADFFLIIQFHY